MTPSALRVLLTGAGAPGVRGTLYALRQNPDGVAIHVVGVDLRPDPVGRHMVEGFHQVPPPESDGYLDAIATICRGDRIDLIVPQTTREIGVLSRHAAQLPARVLVASADAVELANDKHRLLQLFSRVGLPHPVFELATTRDELWNAAARLGYPNRPVVVKPPVSNGMRGLRILKERSWDVERYLHEKPSGVETSLAALSEILERGGAWPRLLVTEYLPGAEYSVDAFVGTETRIALPRLRRAIRDGISFENALDFRDDMSAPTLEAARHIGLRLVFGFQYKLDAGGTPKVLECNPRVQGTMVASLFSGVNVVWLGVREVMEWGPSALVAAAPQTAEFYRFWGGIAVHPDGRAVEI